MLNYTFTIKTIGCKVNLYESNKIKTELIKAGLVFVEVKEKNNYKNIDYYIINTCSVTSIADKKSRQMIHQAKKLNPNLIVIAIGCYVDSHKSNLDEEVDINFNNKNKFDVIAMLKEIQTTSFNQKIDSNLDFEKCQFANSSFKEKFISEKIVKQKENINIREFIKIQDGCNQYCTYCIIPYLRGNIVSRDKEEILTEIKSKIEKGTKEIVLTGIHLSSYGLDKINMTYESDGALEISRECLLNLIRDIADIKDVERIRIGSLEPRIINEQFIEKLNSGKIANKFCFNFCLSLQSGCNKILKSMNRHYTKEDFEKACKIIRKKISYATITTDVIVGFPGETDEDFEESLQFVKSLRFYNPNIFPYSKRAGTKAATYSNQVSNETKHNRVIKMIAECEKITKEIENGFDLIQHPILCEEFIIENGKKYAIGYTKEYIKRKIEI